MGLSVLALLGGGIVAYAIHDYAKDLPDYAHLADYEPPTVTRIHAGDGRLLAEYAREKRIFVPIEAIPKRVQDAFIAAEDQNFRHHFGIDPKGILRAVVDNIKRLRDNRRPAGASTITQQVAKNFLLTNEVSIERKIKEAILAIRMEQAFSKDKILELYLNEIFLGNRSYGVAAAALNYFDKSLDDLTIGEAAYLAGLPKAPSSYDPARNHDAAVERRDYVLGRMAEDGYVTRAEAEAAKDEPLTTRSRAPTEYAHADFFTEEVRRQLVEHFGEEGFYEGGLSVRTTVSPRLQGIADAALRKGLASYDRAHRGYRGPVARIDAKGDWRTALQGVDPGFELADWRLAVVLGLAPESAAIGFADGTKGGLRLADITWARIEDKDGKLGPALAGMADVMAPGDVLLVEPVQTAAKDGTPAPPHWELRQRPSVEGAIAVLDPHTGRVLALSGGFSYRQSKFNRATQALRQPGSAFKPFVYLAALEDGRTPSTIIMDAPIVVDQGPGLPLWRPENYTQTFYGPSTLRLGLEKSRNLMTVRLAQEVGMGRVIDVARRFGIDRGLGPGLASALGSNEVTVLGLTTAYAMLVNGGERIDPVLVERIQDRFGHTVMSREGYACAACSMDAYAGGPPPDLPHDDDAVADPRNAYQMVHILEGVVERGTAKAASRIGKPLAGKTGTTNDSKDAWFVGFSPDLAVGVYVGFDRPESLGRKATGGTVALPIWIDVMRAALEGQPAVPFRTPPGIRLVRIDAATGLLPGPDTAEVIPEAFLPGTEPDRQTPGVAATGLGGGSSRRGNSVSAGGLY
ncbi:MAG: penicillin-binding protein 1A [Geminicoccaceae bacterium]|nr:penicillin-binding protein 1A [Geminicoccaceae bacterium]